MANDKNPKIPKIPKILKIGHGKSKAHEGQNLVALVSKVTAHRKGASAKTNVRVQAGHGVRAEFHLPAIRKGSTR